MVGKARWAEKQIFHVLHVLEAMAPVALWAALSPQRRPGGSGDAPPPDVPRNAANASAGKWVPIRDHPPEAMVEAAD